MAMDAAEIERLIKTRIPDAQVTIRDLAGDGDHYAATVIAPSKFCGKSRVQQHQLVYERYTARWAGCLTRWPCRLARRTAKGACSRIEAAAKKLAARRRTDQGER